MSFKSVVPILVTGMLITGCANSLLTKWQDNMCVANCEPGEKLPARYFEQPVWQTLNMFVGEMLSITPRLLARHICQIFPAKRAQPLLIEEDESAEESPKDHAIPLTGWNVCWFWIPALCDLTATTPYSGLDISNDARALVLWVGVLSVILLRTRLFAFQWFSLVTVMFGVGLVGLSGSLIRSSDETGVVANAADADPELIMGMSLVLLAQLFAATQFVIEDKIMKTYSVEAMLAVGWEGFFGTFTILLALPVIAYFPSIPLTIIPPSSELTSPVLLASFLIMFSIASFNYFGLSVTRSISATARSTIDTCRTLGIWIGSVMLGWEKIKWPGSVPQFIGFGLLVYGTFLFNGLVSPPSFMRTTQPAETPLIGPATTIAILSRALVFRKERGAPF
ncbi:Nucleotide-sugar transporter [Rhizoctonia solani]|uniref:Nucleotide-sugar transporter n=1 Tax=Rhizoctonia solani TaxID=456999 RepID=A0A8H7LYA9_9AGAM|nr:Nucleotide-sugar transporter [Rhizoctonia solani]